MTAAASGARDGPNTSGISLANVSARGEATPGRVGAMIRNVALSWERGILAVVGAPQDGTSTLLAVLAGIARARGGVVTVAGRSPDEARADVAYVPLEPVLPDALRVEEVCALASTIRREPPRPDRLASLGLESLAKRRVKSLSLAEARAVALAIAITSSARVLLVEEPLASLEPTAPGRVVDLLRGRAAAGACVVVTTASVRDATRLGDQLALLTAGALVPLPPGLAHAEGGGARLRVVAKAQGVAALLAALADDPAIASVETHAFASRAPENGASSVVVSGRDVLAVAASIGRAAAKARVDVEAIELAVASLDTIRAALAVPRTQPARPATPPMAMAPQSSRGSLPPSSARSGPPPSLQRPITPVMPSRPAPSSKPPRGDA
ncbi:MAG TPA: ATP-binding cassette domain-containing protein [Labilithrix sp.]